MTRQHSRITARPIALVAAAFAAGALLAIWSKASPLAAACAAVTGCAGALYGHRAGQGAWALLLVAVALLGIARAAVVGTPSPDDISRLAGLRRPCIVEGHIASDPDVAQDRLRFLVKAHSVLDGGRDTPVTGLVSVNIVRRAMPIADEGRQPSLEYGQMVRLEGHVDRPQGPRNSGEFSVRDYLARQGVFAVMWIDRPGALKALTSRTGAAPVRWATDVRRGLQALFAKRFPPDEAGLVSGMLLGSYSMVPDDLIQNFTRSGTLHLLAASGFNCALIVLLFWHGIFKRARAPRMVSIALVVVLILFYVLMVGGKPSIVRAGVGAVLFLCALLLGRPANMVNVLMATAAIMLVWNPMAVVDVGFQLSFAAVAAIVAFVPLLERYTPVPGWKARASRKRNIPARIPLGTATHVVEAAIVTAAATMATLPILAQYFNRVSLVSVPANMAVALLAEGLFVASVALSLLFWIPGVDWVLTQIVMGLAVCVEGVVNTAGSLPFAQVNVSSPGLALTVPYYCALFWAWLWLRRRQR